MFHDVLLMSMKLNDSAILNILGAAYCCIISGISKSKAINLMHNIHLTEKKQNTIKHINLLSYINMDKKNLTFGDIETEKK